MNRTALIATLWLVSVLSGGAFRLAAADDHPNADGLWKWKWVMPDGTASSPKVRLKSDGEKLSGTSIFRAGLEAPIADGKVSGAEVSWTIVREHQGRKVTTRYHGQIAGDSIKGEIVSNWTGDEQRYAWEATRVPNIPTGTWRWRLNFGRGPGGGGGPGGAGGPGGGFGGRGGPGGGLEVRATFQLQGTNVTGKITQFNRETPIENGSFVNGELFFQTVRERDGVKSYTDYWGKLDSDTIKGEIETEVFGERTPRRWEATRVED